VRKTKTKLSEKRLATVGACQEKPGLDEWDEIPGSFEANFKRGVSIATDFTLVKWNEKVGWIL